MRFHASHWCWPTPTRTSRELERSVGWKGAMLTVTLLVLRPAPRRGDVRQRRALPRDRQPTRTEHRITLPTLCCQSHEHAESPSAARCGSSGAAPGCFRPIHHRDKRRWPEAAAAQYSLFYPAVTRPIRPEAWARRWAGHPTHPAATCARIARHVECSQARSDSEESSSCLRRFRCGATERGWQYAPVEDNVAIYNDFVPLLYGTAWYRPPIVFTRNDGNLTHMEVLLGMGPIQGVQKVLVNQIEIPTGTVR